MKSSLKHGWEILGVVWCDGAYEREADIKFHNSPYLIGTHEGDVLFASCLFPFYSNTCDRCYTE